MAYLRALPPVSEFAGFEIPAPVLIIPDVFEPAFCRHLISLYDEHGGEEFGFMRDVDGRRDRRPRPQSQAPQRFHDLGSRPDRPSAEPHYPAGQS